MRKVCNWLLVAAASLLTIDGASAQGDAAKIFEPGRAVTVFVGGSPGGGSDLAVRQVAAALERLFPGTPFEVENRPAGGAQTALQAVTAAKPDGYTFGAAPFPTTVAIILNPERQANFDRSSFEPIASYMFDPGAIAVKADSEYKTLTDLVEAAKAKPGEIAVGVTGAGNREHLDVLALEKLTGADFNPVHFKDGALIVNALLGGNIVANQGSVADFLPQVQAGRLRILAVFDDKRSEYVPEVATASEQGIPLISGVTRAFVFPAGVPKEMVQAMSDAFGKITSDPTVQADAHKMGFGLRYMDSKQLGEFWDAETTRMKELLSSINN